MEKIIEILRDIDDSIEWEKEQGLIDRRLLDLAAVRTDKQRILSHRAVDSPGALMITRAFLIRERTN